MTVAFTNLTSGTDTDGNSTAVTASVTLTANRLHLLTVSSNQFNGSPAEIPTCTGWTQVATFIYYNAGGTDIPSNRLTILRRMPGSNETGTHTIDFNSVSQNEVMYSIDQSDANVETGGTNGSAAIVQSVTNSGNGTALAATLAAFGSTDNGTFGAGTIYASGMTSWTVGTNFTALANIAGGFSTDLSMLTEYRDVNDTSVDATAAATGDWGMIAVEVAAASGGGFTLTADSGSYSLTGQSANTLYARIMPAAQGSYSLTGVDALLVKSGSYSFNAEVGSYTLVGANALVDLSMNAAQGSYALTGQAATLTFAPLSNPSVTAEFGSYTLTGRAANTNYGRLLSAEVGVYALTGRQAGLTWSGAPVSTGYSSQKMTFSTLTISL